jgi:hypothetical protein
LFGSDNKTWREELELNIMSEKETQEERIEILAIFTGEEEEYLPLVECPKGRDHEGILTINGLNGNPIFECKKCPLKFQIQV